MKPLEVTRATVAEYFRVRNLNPGGAFQDPVVTDAMAEDTLALLDEVQSLRRTIQIMKADKHEANELLVRLQEKIKA